MGMNIHHWNHAYVGNVIGYPSGYLSSSVIGYAYPPFNPYPAGTAFMYEWTNANNSGLGETNMVPIWQLAPVTTAPGYGGPDFPSLLPGANTQTALNTLIRDGNFDYFSGVVHWHGVPTSLGVGATNYGPLCSDGNSNCASEYVTPPAVATLPASLYITVGPPPFFKSTYCPGQNPCKWPWVDGSSADSPLPGALPARLRFDSGTPNKIQ